MFPRFQLWWEIFEKILTRKFECISNLLYRFWNILFNICYIYVWTFYLLFYIYFNKLELASDWLLADWLIVAWCPAENISCIFRTRISFTVHVKSNYKVMKDQPGQQLSTAIGKDWRVGKEQTIRYQYFDTKKPIWCVN